MLQLLRPSIQGLPPVTLDPHLQARRLELPTMQIHPETGMSYDARNEISPILIYLQGLKTTPTRETLWLLTKSLLATRTYEDRVRSVATPGEAQHIDVILGIDIMPLIRAWDEMVSLLHDLGREIQKSVATGAGIAPMIEQICRDDALLGYIHACDAVLFPRH